MVELREASGPARLSGHRVRLPRLRGLADSRRSSCLPPRGGRRRGDESSPRARRTEGVRCGSFYGRHRRACCGREYPAEREWSRQPFGSRVFQLARRAEAGTAADGAGPLRGRTARFRLRAGRAEALRGRGLGRQGHSCASDRPARRRPGAVRRAGASARRRVHPLSLSPEVDSRRDGASLARRARTAPRHRRRRGHPAGWWNPLDYNVASICVPIATHVPHAAGLAWGKKLRGERAVAIAYFGDGATSEGSFHEGANFAGVTKAPAILFCNNNHWAISTPLSAQTAAETLADKAAGYGMPGARVDGGDVLAVFEATRAAVERARSGEGPSFIEAGTYRTAPHATADDQAAYIDLERVEEEKRNECVGRYERYLQRLGVLTDARAEEIRREALERMREGIAAAEAEPPADVDLLFRNAYVNSPSSFDEELAELRKILRP